MKNFQLGQIVKHNSGLIAHYAIVVADNRTIGWVNNSTLEVKPIDGDNWEIVKIRNEAFEFEEIKRNIKSFKDALEAGKARKYNLSEFNCEHWATLMVTGKSYSTQSGAVKSGRSKILHGVMYGIGSSTGTVVTIVSTLGINASTGAAISTLNGAAATNATLAWLGGGTIAAGGGGVAAGTAILTAVSTGGAVVAIAGLGIISKKIWENLDEEQRQEIADKIDSSTPEQVKVVYGVSTEKAKEIIGSASTWIGSNTSKTAKYIQTLGKSQEAKLILDQTTQIAGVAGTLALGTASIVGKESLNKINNLSQKIGSWWEKY